MRHLEKALVAQGGASGAESTLETAPPPPPLPLGRWGGGAVEQVPKSQVAQKGGNLMMEIMGRPQPPAEALDPLTECFAPDDELRAWVVATFIESNGPLANPDHQHLTDAAIGCVWTNVPNGRNMRTVIGQAELMPPMAMGKWQRARAEAQITEWFGTVPDFMLTFFAPAAATMTHAEFCALVEHELYHCGQDRDIYGAPKFTRDGAPKFAIRGHDVEEFVGVVARYGAAASGVSDMVRAANEGPTIALANIAGACGTCLRAAA